MSQALLLQGVAGYHVEPGTPSPHQMFAAVLLGRPFEEPDLAIRACTRWAVAEASRAVGTGRVAVDRADLLAFRMIYRALRTDAAAVKPGVAPVKGEAQWRRSLWALSSIRHRQRALLTLRHVLCLSSEDAGWVIGVRNVDSLEAPAIQRMLKAIAGPADVPRALRTAGRKLCPPVKAEEPLPAIAHLPRKVVRTLIAPLLEPAVEPSPVEEHRSPVEVLIRAHPKPEPCIPGAPPRPSNRLWSIAARVASAAAVAALFVWAVWPATH